jgi:DNA-binding response OmpR family regulator
MMVSAKARILIIDDEKLILSGLKMVFLDEGYDVAVAQSGKQAIELIKQKKFDLVFTDLMMPEMDGVSICKEIKNIYPETEVILFSGHPEAVAERSVDFINAGGRDEIIRKPFDGQELIEVAQKILG